MTLLNADAVQFSSIQFLQFTVEIDRSFSYFMCPLLSAALRQYWLKVIRFFFFDGCFLPFLGSTFFSCKSIIQQWACISFGSSSWDRDGSIVGTLPSPSIYLSVSRSIAFLAADPCWVPICCNKCLLHRYILSPVICTAIPMHCGIGEV